MRPTNLKTRTYAILIAAVAALVSCHKKDHQDQTTTPSGTLTGVVQTWDDKMNQTNDKGGITVNAQSSGGNSSTTTDTSGKFTFNSLPFGTYTLVFSKDGYGTTKIIGVSHAANSTQSPTVVDTLNFGKISTTTVTKLGVRDTLFNSQPGIRFDYGFAPAPSSTSPVFARVFFGTDSTVSSTNYTVTDSLQPFKVYVPIGFTDSTLKTKGFSAGQTVYLRLYGDSYINNSYVDSTGKRAFPNVNPVAPKATWRVIQ